MSWIRPESRYRKLAPRKYPATDRRNPMGMMFNPEDIRKFIQEEQGGQEPAGKENIPSIGSSLGYLNKPNILSKGLFSLYGHTHQEDDTFYGFPCTYHVGVDSHGMYPVSLEEVWKAIEENVRAFQQDGTVVNKELEEYIRH